MEYLIAFFLGIVQGFTEFLPVSSSGHLVLAQALFPQFNKPGILFEVVLHGGTLMSVLYYFRKDLLKIDTKYFLLIAVATIPAVIIGLLFKLPFESLFDKVQWIGLFLVVTGLLNLIVDGFKDKDTNITKAKSLFIGLFQAIAIIPGISRSGSTIFAARFLGIKAQNAAKFSFLLSIPAVLGANLLQIIDIQNAYQFDLTIFLIGFFAAFLSGVIAINLVYKTLLARNFKIFGVYCVLMGMASLLVFNL